MNMLNILSTLVLFIIAYGVIKRNDRKVHIPVMTAAFLIDLGLVLYIELNRGAVEQAIDGVEGLLLFHIIVSALVLVLYIALTVIGVKLLKNPAMMKLHRNLAAAFIICRLTNYVTSFFIT